MFTVYMISCTSVSAYFQISVSIFVLPLYQDNVNDHLSSHLIIPKKSSHPLIIANEIRLYYCLVGRAKRAKFSSPNSYSPRSQKITKLHISIDFVF
jgi:hypothetical protein